MLHFPNKMFASLKSSLFLVHWKTYFAGNKEMPMIYMYRQVHQMYNVDI